MKISDEDLKHESKEDFVNRVRGIDRIERERNTKIVIAFLTIAFGLAGYILLIVVDWRIALGMFLIMWSLNMERKNFNGK